MATYVVLGNFTDQGLQNAGTSPERAREFQAQVEAAGVQVKHIYWTLGCYDFLVIVETQDEEGFAAGVLALAAGGNVRTQTLRAFDADAMTRIVERMQPL